MKSSQPPNVADCFRFLFQQFLPDRIVELGTGNGHFTCWLAKAAPSATIFTYDNEESLRWDQSIAVPANVRLTRDSIWDREREIIGLVADPAVRTLLLCDNGDKIREFQAFAPHLSAGDVVMVHDYWPSREEFAETIKGKFWDWCEIVDDDITDTLKDYGLVPFHSAKMRQAMWGCWMRRIEVAEVTVETCRYREPLHLPGEHGVARCEYLAGLIGTGCEQSCHVTRAHCSACCESFQPSPGHPNPVLASLLYERLQNNELDQPVDRVQRAHLEEVVNRHLTIDDDARPGETFTVFKDKPVAEVIPMPQSRFGEQVREWSVAVTTSPRSSPVLGRCLRHLAIAGWKRPSLFVDAPVQIPDEFRALPRTLRDSAVGAWPNYYLALMEMYLREPAADAYMILQDDALLPPMEDLRAYLERILWPGRDRAIVSLYCATPDTKANFGWARRSGWDYGALAFIFPPTVVQEFLTNRSVLAHRLRGEDRGLTGIPEVISAWARQHAVAFYYPTPSLIQHIGIASTLWSSSGRVSPQRSATMEFDG